MNKNDIIEILLKDPDEDKIFAEADLTRKKIFGEEVHLRGLIEFSNICARNCHYCGLRKDNPFVKRYRMSKEEIISSCKQAWEMGLKSVVLQSGEDGYFTARVMEEIISSIKSLTGLAITLSIGEMPRADYFRLKEAGADRFFMRFETSDPALFSRYKPDSSYIRRFDCLRWMKEAGFQVGSGIMVGLPGQDIQSLARDIMLFRELDLDMIGIGPFIAHPDTPLAGKNKNNLKAALKVLAVTRILCPKAHMPAASAMEALSPMGRESALKAGANVIMPNITPEKYRKEYILYPGKIALSQSPIETVQKAREFIKSIGRKESLDYGHALRMKDETKSA
ncbi:MAG: [FeFe] hydrogenase H-cluster radical SAM maturase HydE [Elusimicrobia bacterium]|nr:[FeFe] hydrogenase H-cluster radical SAM maturase HydE [Elusimicrobiota bacterium]